LRRRRRVSGYHALFFQEETMGRFTACVFCSRAQIALMVIVALVAGTPTLEARVKKIVIEKKTSPAFDGASFGPAGQYETLVGKAYGELDPKDPHNAIITDIALAPRNAKGLV